MLFIVMILATMLQYHPDGSESSFYDDFSDNNISDWEQRCLPGTWGVSSGLIHGSTSNVCSSLLPPGNVQYEDCSVSISGTAVHVLGVVARLNASDTGIYAYVSPDHDVARIRLVSNGVSSTIYESLYTSFPGGVWYELNLTCEGTTLHLQIDVPSTGQSWDLYAIDPYPQTGQFGLAMGDEPSAHWDWISVTSGGSSPGDSTMISWMYTDDTAAGNGNMALEADEETDLFLQLSNPESYALENSFAILQSLSSDITVNSNFNDFGTIAVGGTSWGSGCFNINTQLSTPENETYPLQLTVFADNGYVNTFSFSIPVGLGMECDVESVIDDWEWNPVEAGWLDNWHVSNSRNHTTGGSSSFKCGDTGSGDYDNHLYSELVSPLINIPLYGDVTFWSWIDAQIPLDGITALSAYDGGLLQYGRCGTWIDLQPSAGYPYEVVPSSTGPFSEGTGVFSGTSGWTQWTVHIPDSLAGPGQFRFIFGSDDNGTREGWYIDDINVTGFVGIEGPETAVDEFQLFTAYPNPFAGSLTFTLAGIPDGEVSIEIFDLAGRLVASPVMSDPGEVRTLVWSGQDIPAGIYIARISVEGSGELVQNIVKID
jgi:hypothetical protein